MSHGHAMKGVLLATGILLSVGGFATLVSALSGPGLPLNADELDRIRGESYFRGITLGGTCNQVYGTQCGGPGGGCTVCDVNFAGSTATPFSGSGYTTAAPINCGSLWSGTCDASSQCTVSLVNIGACGTLPNAVHQ